MRASSTPPPQQPLLSEYAHSSYLTPARMSSIGGQLALCEETGAQTFLEVGAGSQLLGFLLGRQGKRVLTMDIDADVEPNMIAALPTIPLADRSVDASLCFQVLEHLPLKDFAACLGELARVSRRWVIISLPDRTVKLNRKIKLRQAVYHVLHFPQQWRPATIPAIHAQHFWELGQNGVGYDDVLTAARESDLEPVRNFRNRLNTYHMFFVFERTDAVSPS